METMLLIAFICVVAILIIGYHMLKRVESYADYIADPWDGPMYNLLPKDFNVFLINLDTKKDRLDNFINAYKKTDFVSIKQFERVAAVNGRALALEQYVAEKGLIDIEIIEERGFRVKHNQLTRGAVGCYLSHMNVYKMIRSRPEPYGIIFEDDVKFMGRDIYRSLRSLLAQIPDDWDMLLMGCQCHVCRVHEHHKDLEHFFLTHAYIIKKEGAIRILNELEFLPMRQQIDSELSVLATQKKIKIYCLKNQLVLQDSSVNATSIQTPMRVVSGVNPYSLL